MKDYASIAEPLTELTKKSLPENVKWSSNAQLAFEKLKQNVGLSTPDAESGRQSDFHFTN